MLPAEGEIRRIKMVKSKQMGKGGFLGGFFAAQAGFLAALDGKKTVEAVQDGPDILLKSENDVLSLIDSIVGDIRNNNSLAAFFDKSLNDLEGLREMVGNHDTRIAIIGITSSGKSTLMNAVLGAPMLPTRVGPSSSKQVLCGWDKVAEGEVVFSADAEKETRRIRGNADKIRSVLEKYGDEKFNPHNREQVDEIRVHAPGFRFNRDLVIIDTPGLDAYGLDQHKEVTMKLVLPTVDMVMFLTNVKCDSDAKNLEFIDNVTSDEKPLVVVQNKIDSIEPKISKRGVEKTVDDIRIEHKIRLKKLLANAKKASVRNAPIVQVSAKAPKWEDTNLAELGRVLDEQICINSGARVARRVRQLARIIEEMSEALKGKLSENAKDDKARTAAKRSVAIWQSSLQELIKNRDEVDSGIKRRISTIRSARETLLKTIDQEYLVTSTRWLLSGSSGESKYKRPEKLAESVVSLRSKFEKLIKDFNSYFSSSITEIQDETAKCCREIGVDESKTIRRSVFRSAIVSITASQKTVKRKEVYQVKKSGFRGGVARFFGSIFGQDDWGYETHTRTVTSVEYDIDDLIANINSAYYSFVRAVEGQIETFGKNISYAIGVLGDEVEAKKKSLIDQQRQAIPVAEGKMLLERMTEFKDLAYEQTPISVENAADGSGIAVPARQRFSEVEVPKYIKLVADYAHQLSFEQSYAFFNAIVTSASLPSVVVCGWDPEKLERFVSYYVKEPDKVQVVNFNDPCARMPSATALVFLLVNAEQAGSYRGKIFGGGEPTKYINSVIKSGKLVWVMDSVREHVSIDAADSFVDAATEMFMIMADALKGRQAFEVMVCDRELYWSAILHEMHFNKAIRASEVELQRCVAEISDIFKLSGKRRHMTGRYLSQLKTRKGK